MKNIKLPKASAALEAQLAKIRSINVGDLLAACVEGVTFPLATADVERDAQLAQSIEKRGDEIVATFKEAIRGPFVGVLVALTEDLKRQAHVPRIPELEAQSQLAELFRKFNTQGWLSNEAEFIRSELQPGEIVIDITPRNVKTSLLRIIDRAALRAKHKPVAFLDARWEASFPPIPAEN